MEEPKYDASIPPIRETIAEIRDEAFADATPEDWEQLELIEARAAWKDKASDACEGMPDPVAGVAGLKDKAMRAVHGMEDKGLGEWWVCTELKAALDAAGG